MARPVILATDDPNILRPDSGETALDIVGKLELRGDPLTPDSRRARSASSSACRQRKEP
jgi:hypothetical protein